MAPQGSTGLALVLLVVLSVALLLHTNASLKSLVARTRQHTRLALRSSVDLAQHQSLQKVMHEVERSGRETRAELSQLRAEVAQLRKSVNAIPSLVQQVRVPQGDARVAEEPEQRQAKAPLQSGIFQATTEFPQFNTESPWTQMALRPRLFLAKQFISRENCDELIKLAAPELNRTEVVGEKGEGLVSAVRTNTGMFLSRNEHFAHPAVRTLMQKVAKFTSSAVENIEPLNILRYTAGQFYRAHMDWFSPQYEQLLKRGGQRIATCLVNLNDIEQGGETEFPRAGVKLKGSKGDAIIWWNVDANGKEDDFALHAGTPPANGSVKWAAVAWVHASNFYSNDIRQAPSSGSGGASNQDGKFAALDHLFRNVTR
eukprot:TRINITY_DN53613_c0_g1_i1.p1 TRINITY_DN53613_c0_g1~~TRINITY_DN53613_c0_g1_i1.p1  ORF type:complete len:378 (+),score=78.83 TRINITY_DN53613_c0_g1_i1:22-1134(+)